MRILVTVPNEYWVHKHVAIVCLSLLKDRRYELRIMFPTHRPYEHNLNRIAKDFHANGDDFWLNIDSDNPPMKNPLDLVALDRDIIGLPTPVWHYTGKPKERPLYWNVYKKVRGGYTEWRVREGLQEVDGIGTGCFMISRRVFDKEQMRRGAFLRKWDREGLVDLGNDLAFSERAISQGFKIHAHFDYPCRHYHFLELAEVSSAFINLYGA